MEVNVKYKTHLGNVPHHLPQLIRYIISTCGGSCSIPSHGSYMYRWSDEDDETG